jgi:3-oxoadipate enol-lactonase
MPGVELYYEDHGSGEPVVLLHGLGSSTLDWEPQIAALSPRYRTIAIDMRGSGRSRDRNGRNDPAGPFSVAMFADDVAAVIEHLGVAPAHIIGLSMGGMVAFQLAVTHPRTVRTLTIINSGPAFVPRTLQEYSFVALRLAVTSACGPRGMARLLGKRLFPRNERGRALFTQRMALNHPKAYSATQRALVGFDISARIGEIAVPALIVASDQDYTPVARKHEYARAMRDAHVVVVPDSRHALPLEEPEKLQPILDAFLADHARKGKGKGDDTAASG